MDGQPTFFTARDAASTANRDLCDARWGCLLGTQLPASNEMASLSVELASILRLSLCFGPCWIHDLKFAQAQRVIGLGLDPFLLLI